MELCRRLDGLPPAIELAAVRTRVLAVEQILDRLAAVNRAAAEGARVAREAAIRLALGESQDDAESVTDDDTSPLGRREAEVARLIADGLANKQIATRLFISERTVDSHVRSILNKLGFRTRTQIAARLAAPSPENTPRRQRFAHQNRETPTESGLRHGMLSRRGR